MKHSFRMNRFKKIFEDAKWFKRAFKGVPDVPISLAPEIQKQSERLAERLEKVPAEMRELSTELAKRGWYINMDMPFKFLYTVRPLIKAAKVKEVDKIMVSYLQHHLEPVENEIMSVFPLRAQILSAAFRAHVQKTYTLSVPVFLAQADGVCSELLGVGVYSRKNRIPKTASAVEQFKHDDFLSSILEPLRVSGALAASEDERHQYRYILNRHEVLHGKSLNYATELNSFRSISLLSYLCSVVQGAFDLEKAVKEQKQQTGSS